MIKIERTSVMNFENAIRGARNPMNSWGRMDSHTEPDGTFVFGENDLSLAKRLCKAGTDHRKFIRQIFVSVDLTAPIYWWKEFDTYKVGTVANSTSTMHKIQAKTFEEADFSCDRMVPAAKESLMQTANRLGIAGAVELPGQSKTLLEDINDCAMFVLSSDYEGMPNALIEAMACGMSCS